MRLRAAVLAGGILAMSLVAPAAHAQSCVRTVVFTLPGVTWSDVEAFEPPELLRLVEEGAVGSISVRTNTSRTSYTSGFATIGAGARLDGGTTAGAPAGSLRTEEPFEVDLRVGGMDEIAELSDEAGYGAVGGALAAAVDAPVIAIGNGDAGLPAPIPLRQGRPTLLAAMDPSGVVELAATSRRLLEADEDSPFGVRTNEEALEEALDAALERCGVLIVEHGDPLRADLLAGLRDEPLEAERREALLRADEALAHIAGSLDPESDLLLVVSPTSPAWDRVAHLGVALAVGPGYGAGDTLKSASTRRAGLVTLPDVAPTILEFLNLDRSDDMKGRPFVSVTTAADRIEAAIDLDAESVFIDGVKNKINTTFVLFQIAIYLLALLLLSWRERRKIPSAGALGRTLEAAGLGIVAFPISTFLVGVLPAHDLGLAPYVLAIVGIDAVLVAAVWLARRRALDRLLILAGGTLALLSLDLVSGSRLQINTVFGYSPIVAGRFSGAGNIAFSVLAATAVLTAALIVHRWGTGRRILALVAILFAVVIVIDGAPPFGSDVGGVIALAPGFTITWMLLAGIRPSLKSLGVAAVGAVVTLAVFLAIDLSRPAATRTHLGRLFEDIGARGYGILWDTIARKAEANLRVFRTSIYTLFVPPALGTMAWLLRRPVGQWHEMAARYPKLWQGMIAGLVVSLFGFATNDSGIVIPAVILSFLVPTALLIHLLIGKVIHDPR